MVEGDTYVYQLCTIIILTAGSSPVVLTGLSPGRHVLKVVPTGCGGNKMNLKAEIIIE